MSEPKRILVGLKVWKEDHDWVADEQDRIRKAERKKLSQAELFCRMRRAYEAASPSSADAIASGEILTTKPLQFDVISPERPPEINKLHKKLDEILDGGVALEAIAYNLESFYLLTEFIHGRGGPDPEKARLDIKQGVEQLRAGAERARRHIQAAKEAGKAIRPAKTKPPKKASGGSGD